MIRSPLDLFTSVFSQEMIERIGWVLIHSIWQFTLLAIFALVMLQLMHRYSASIRYLLLSAIMFATVVVPVATWLAMGSSRLTNNRQSIAKTDHESLFPKITSQASSASSSELQTKVAVEAIAIEDSRSQVSSDIPKSFTSQSPFQSRSVDPWRSRIASFVQPWLPVSVSVWCLGVLVFSLRPILSWWTIRRMQTVGVTCVTDFGTASNGLQFRLIALSPEVKDDAPELKNKVKSFKRSADMTFAVELKNVSSEPIMLAGLRYGEGYAEESKGKLNTAMLAPFWFEFEFTDMQG